MKLVATLRMPFSEEKAEDISITIDFIEYVKCWIHVHYVENGKDKVLMIDPMRIQKFNVVK